MAGATARLRRPTRPGSRAAPLIRAVPHVDRAGRGGSAESGARRARAATTATAALGLACVHRSVVLGALSRAEVDSKHRLRGLALEGVHGLGESRADTDLNARHGSLEPNNRVGAAHDDGAAQARYRRRGAIDESHCYTIAAQGSLMV